jgi:hypothetical protein
VTETIKLSRDEILDKANCLQRRVEMQRKDKQAFRTECGRVVDLLYVDPGAAHIILRKVVDPDWDPALDTATQHLYEK